MKFSENLNLPILQDGDKYSKEIQNEAFNTIDKECTNIKNTIKSILDINDDVTDAIKTLGDISEELSDLKEKQNEDYYELLESNNYIGEKIRDINSQLDTNTKKIYKSCSEIGMTVNDDNNNNHILMSKFINLGYSLKVDDFYNVNINSSIEINNNIEFISENKNHGFNFISDANNTCWRIINGCSKIIAENLTIKGSKVILFTQSDMSHFMDLINFKNNKVVGDFVLLYLKCDTELTDNCKINKIVINNNHLEIKYIDIYDESSYARGFVNVINIPFDSIDVHYNTLLNMERTFGYFSVDDSNSYREEHGSTDYLTNARKFINVTNNFVKNDDDCICPFEYTGLRYCCFILAECFELTYKNNYVDGIKSDRIKGTVESNLETLELYDVYVAADYFIYHNNVNKNVITFGGTKLSERNYLIKCKYSKNISVLNNRFIREHSLIERLGITDDIYMESLLVDNASGTKKGNWIISNNIIDCYTLTAETEKINADYYEISNNTINAKYIYKYLLRMIGADIKTLKIIGNKFYASDEAIGKPFVILNGVYESGITYDDIKNTNIFIENNIFDIKNFYNDYTLGDSAETSTQYVYQENMIIRNNVFYDRPKFKYINSNFIYKDNTYLVNNNFGRFTPETVYNKTDIKENFNVSNKEGNITLISLGNNINDRFKYQQLASRLISVNLKYIMNDVSIKNVNFNIIYDDINKKIKCLNTGSIYDITVDLSTTNITVDNITFVIRRSGGSGSLATRIPTGALMLETNVKVEPSILLT